MKIETERLFLREMATDDFDALNLVLGDAENTRYYPGPFDGERVRLWIERNRERYAVFGFGLWAVCRKDTGEMIGDCGLSMQVIDGVIRPEIGYHIRRDMQRKGYAGEAARAVRDWAFARTPFRTIYSYMREANEPSARTARAWGARFAWAYEDERNGRTRVYAMTREAWEAGQSKERGIPCDI